MSCGRIPAAFTDIEQPARKLPDVGLIERKRPEVLDLTADGFFPVLDLLPPGLDSERPAAGGARNSLLLQSNALGLTQPDVADPPGQGVLRHPELIADFLKRTAACS